MDKSLGLNVLVECLDKMRAVFGSLSLLARYLWHFHLEELIAFDICSVRVFQDV